MKTYSPFIEHLTELYTPLGGVMVKRMFGGYGLFKNGLMFAIVDHDELFLKVDDVIRKEFEQRNLKKFTYKKQGKDASLSYYQAPAECLDQSEILIEWSRKSIDASLRNKK